LVRNAVDLRKNGNEDLSPVDVRLMSGEVLDLLRPVAPAGIEIRVGTTADETIVVANSTQLKRVIMTLCLNAFEAMQSSGGVLHVDLDVVKREGPEGFELPYVRLTVTDTGQGMRQDLTKMVFDTFRAAGSAVDGPDMTMPLAYEIVRSLGGDITVESELGKGTVIQALIPQHVAKTHSQGDKKAFNGC
jgi:signal transduction histidine kinase